MSFDYNLFRTVATVGISSPQREESSYLSFMKEFRRQDPRICSYIGNVTVISGSGWGINVSYTYGLTFEGIELALDLFKIKASVARSLQKFSAEFLVMRNDQPISLVSDSAVINNGEDASSHALSVFARKTDHIFQMIVNDSEGKSNTCQAVCSLVKTLFPSLKIKILTSAVDRQQSLQTCYAFAINDYSVLQDHPEIFDEIFTLNNVDVNNETQEVIKIKQLPSGLHINSVNKAVDLQEGVIRHLQCKVSKPITIQNIQPADQKEGYIPFGW